jgi:hypothetical protein
MIDDCEVDDFIDSYQTDAYASWVLHHMRLPAMLKSKFREQMRPFRLFCDYDGLRYRVVMASRMGDIGLTLDLEAEHGYAIRVGPRQCYNWGPES